MTAARGVCRSDDEKNENVQAKSVSLRRPRPVLCISPWKCKRSADVKWRDVKEARGERNGRKTHVGCAMLGFVNVTLDMNQKRAARAEKKSHSHMEGLAENFLRRENSIFGGVLRCTKIFSAFGEAKVSKEGGQGGAPHGVHWTQQRRITFNVA